MMAAAVEVNHERISLEHEKNLIASTEYLDKLYRVYAAVYKHYDGQLIKITRRFQDEMEGPDDMYFDPFDYPEFVRDIASNDYGGIVVDYRANNNVMHNLHIYYRWMPLYSPPDERYLVVAGVSKYSITSKIAHWETGGHWISIVITAIVCLWGVILLIRLGHVHDSRRGRDKYRDKRVM